jgi:four helix bundle protein
MKGNNVLVDESFKFAVRIVKLYKYLSENKKEFILSKQVLRSGTSIGANINEAQEAQSKNDFISKLSISLQEARETNYWIKLLKETDNILNDLIELIKLLVSFLKTTKKI